MKRHAVLACCQTRDDTRPIFVWWLHVSGFLFCRSLFKNQRRASASYSTLYPNLHHRFGLCYLSNSEFSPAAIGLAHV